MRAAVPTLAPKSRAVRAMTGMIAPVPIAEKNTGPYAGIAIGFRSRNDGALTPPT